MNLTTLFKLYFIDDIHLHLSTTACMCLDKLARSHTAINAGSLVRLSTNVTSVELCKLQRSSILNIVCKICNRGIFKFSCSLT